MGNRVTIMLDGVEVGRAQVIPEQTPRVTGVHYDDSLKLLVYNDQSSVTFGQVEKDVVIGSITIDKEGVLPLYLSPNASSIGYVYINNDMYEVMHE